MRKRHKGAKLSKSKAHRNAMLLNLSQDLIRYKSIKTTLPKAKALRPYFEPIITRALKEKVDEKEKRSSFVGIQDKEVLRILFEEIVPNFKESKHNGGYTRIIKLGQRQGDAAETAIIELVA